MVQTQATRQISYIQAVNEALRQELERDESVIIMGEDIAGGGEREQFQDAWGGPMRLTKGLIGDFGPQRIRDTPIAESGFVGAGVGAAATGLRPVVDLMYVGFLGVCGDQILNNAAKIHYMFGGKVKGAADHHDRHRRRHQLRGAALRDRLFGVHALSGAEGRSVRPTHITPRGCSPRPYATMTPLSCATIAS